MVRMLRLLLGLSAIALLSPAAAAQEDPDSLVAATDLTGALGTLERVLFAFPEAVPPRLLYASLLCRLDDRQGAELELGLLAGKRIDDSDWTGVTAACGPVPRPPSRKGKKK